MNESVSGVKKVDVFNDIVSRLEDSKKARVSDDVVSGMKNYYNNKQDYRSRVQLLANNLAGVKPIDSEVNNVIYLSNYMEKGIAIKTSIVSFKQIWVEYRLIYNENAYKEENKNVVDDNTSVMFNNSELKMPDYNELNSFEIPSFKTVNNDNYKIPEIDTNNDIVGVNEPKMFDTTNFNIENNIHDEKEQYGNLINKNEPMPFEVPSYNFDNNMQVPERENNYNKSEVKLDEPMTFEVPNFDNRFNSFDSNLNADKVDNFSGLSTNEYSFSNLSLGLENISNKLDDNYKKLYDKVVSINRYVESFNRKKIELDRQIDTLEHRKNELSNELRELENAKLEFSRYRESEERKLTDMKNDVNNKVVSLQNLIDNLDSILGKIN